MMSDTEIGYIDYTNLNVDKNATYDSLRDRVVLITGAGQAIGRGYAHYFSAQGAIPIIADINGDNAEKVLREIEEKQGKAMAVQVDVADEKSNIDMVDKILAEYGRLDVLINNAAIFSQITMAPFWELPVDEWKRAVDVNVNGAFLCSRAAVKPMIEAKWGRIINVSSGTMMMGRPNYLHYITTKAAMIGMSRSMAREVGPYGITVNTFWPGVMQTEVERPSVPREMFKTMTESQALPRQGTIHDLAKAMMFLCSDEAAYITGQGLIVDGGQNFI
ncbi:MAG: glucose 1-dehydrogenase [Alphaproteobacteria bacterium]|jgi:3-oxoacyl-[acyl-carrier protein] reductase|nr:glucose 1-dehydrogenase [Alphaproteobacteria bacterium]